MRPESKNLLQKKNYMKAAAGRLALSSVAGLAVLIPLSFGPGSKALAATGTWQDISNGQTFNSPGGIAVDRFGDVFVVNLAATGTTNAVMELASGSSTWKDITYGEPFHFPGGIAVDSKGDVFVTNSGNTTINAVMELPVNSHTWEDITKGYSFGSPSGIAVDNYQNVYVTDYHYNTIVALPYQGSTWQDITNVGSFNGPTGITVYGAGTDEHLFVTNRFSTTTDNVEEVTISNSSIGSIGSVGTWQDITNGGSFNFPFGIAANNVGDVFVTNLYNTTTNAVDEWSPVTKAWKDITGSGAFNGPTGIAFDLAGDMFVANAANTAANAVVEYVVPRKTPPVLQSQAVTVDGVPALVIGNLGYNPLQAIQYGTYFGYVEERAAIEHGASFSGEGTNSAYMSAILSGSGVGADLHVSPVQQGEFAALYQKLGIIPTWTNNSVSIPQGVKALITAGASTLAIENYLVQMDGFSWSVADAQAGAGFPIQAQ